MGVPLQACEHANSRTESTDSAAISTVRFRTLFFYFALQFVVQCTPIYVECLATDRRDSVLSILFGDTMTEL